KLKFEVDIKAPKEKFMPVPDELALLPHKLKNKYRELNDVPISTDLSKDRIQGFISRSSQELERLFINISLQIAATTGPELIRMVFLFSDNTIPRDTIRSMRWLPQAVGDDEHYVCIGRDRVDEFLCRLDGIIKDHEHMMIRWIIFTDDHKRIPSSIISREDVILMIFAKEYRQLPGECRCIIQNDGSYRGMLMPGSEELRKDINFDHISAREADIYARRIAGICRYIKPTARQVPALVTLPMLYDKGMITAKDIAAGWNENNTWNSIRAPIGMAEDSRVVSLDIHEKAHGPHGLVAGMTGSGKSELLQTMILSFALRYPPWEIGFFLIDYKGGGMASMFEGLPHLIGSISNLSGNITDRALLSIRSENERRQRLFLDAGVNSIRDYGRLFSTGKVNEPLPHILIIIDEFAELKRDQPEFMKELISVAQVGRSLGVHLILATQKPAGTVDDNIFSNSRFRICLRVQDRQDSNDMLHRPDAAYIKEPGRAYLQVGNDELFEEFQSGYTMEPYNGEEEGASLYLLDINGRRIDVADRPLKNEGEDTHFSVLMNVLKDCFAGAEKIPVQKLWLPELDSTMIIDNETMMSSGEESGVIIGRYDDPENRLQGFIRIDILKTGHIAICGSALSGKSTFLQTLIMSWIKRQDIINTAIYIVDYSNGMLSCFKESHAVGAYINEEHSDRLGNLFCMLKDIVDERRLNYEGISFSNRILSDNDHDEAVILIIDNYGAFREKTDCAYDDILQELIKSGENYGVFTVITGSMIGSADIPARLFENIKSGICLRLNDRYQYSECLRRIHLPTMPKDMPGRGLACVNDRILEFQTYLCFTGDDMCRNEIIKSEVMSLNNNGMTKAAMKAPYIPHEPVVYDLDKALEGISLKPGQLPIGYDAVSARPFAPDVSKVSCIVFAGASGSGRSNACRVAGYYADKAGRRVIYADSIRSICDHIKEAGDAMVICDGMEKAIDEFYRNDRDKDIGDEMADILSDPKEHILVFSFLSTAHTLVAGRKLYELIRSACLGIYLGGCLDRQNMFDFSYLSYSGQCKSRQPGNGTVLRRGNRIRSCDIVIPHADI
ncbi:MAG: hypothetical protein IKT17_02370, partial [Lachnospiraceae bacterium]|nr:hypothetical protein [Lachnospiraceae bacterium]